ncbi:hypothetical protein CFOL_v3_35092, partial [Cephalotus follicularis]
QHSIIPVNTNKQYDTQQQNQKLPKIAISSYNNNDDDEMRSLTQLSPKSFLFSSLILSLLLKLALGDGGFCSAAPSILQTDKPMYWKVTNPTLSPTHLQDLPGFTRSVYRSDHALITPESHVFSPLLDWSNTLGAYLITPAMGSHFVMYLAKMQ